IQLHYRMYGLAGTRINVALTDGPSPAGTVRPLDGRGANVHRVCALGQVFNAEGVPETSLFERRIPPQGTGARGRTHRLWKGPVGEKDNRLGWRSQRRALVFFFLG